MLEKAKKKFPFSKNDVVLARYGNDLFYAKILSINYKRKLAKLLFDDDSKEEIGFKKIFSVNEETSEIICIICKSDKTDSANDIVLCDTCNVGYHQLCHQPPISSDVLLPEVPWECFYCQTKEQNPHVSDNPFNESETQGDEQQTKKMDSQSTTLETSFTIAEDLKLKEQSHSKDIDNLKESIKTGMILDDHIDIDEIDQNNNETTPSEKFNNDRVVIAHADSTSNDDIIIDIESEATIPTLANDSRIENEKYTVTSCSTVTGEKVVGSELKYVSIQSDISNAERSEINNYEVDTKATSLKQKTIVKEDSRNPQGFRPIYQGAEHIVNKGNTIETYATQLPQSRAYINQRPTNDYRRCNFNNPDNTDIPNDSYIFNTNQRAIHSRFRTEDDRITIVEETRVKTQKIETSNAIPSKSMHEEQNDSRLGCPRSAMKNTEYMVMKRNHNDIKQEMNNIPETFKPIDDHSTHSRTPVLLQEMQIDQMYDYNNNSKCKKPVYFSSRPHIGNNSDITEEIESRLDLQKKWISRHDGKRNIYERSEKQRQIYIPDQSRNIGSSRKIQNRTFNSNCGGSSMHIIREELEEESFHNNRHVDIVMSPSHHSSNRSQIISPREPSYSVQVRHKNDSDTQRRSPQYYRKGTSYHNEPLLCRRLSVESNSPIRNVRHHRQDQYNDALDSSKNVCVRIVKDKQPTSQHQDIVFTDRHSLLHESTRQRHQIIPGHQTKHRIQHHPYTFVERKNAEYHYPRVFCEDTIEEVFVIPRSRHLSEPNFAETYHIKPNHLTLKRTISEPPQNSIYSKKPKVGNSRSVSPPIRRTDQEKFVESRILPVKKEIQIQETFASTTERKVTKKRVCNRCNGDASFLCSGCRKMWYCTQKCQLDDWSDHCDECKRSAKGK